MRCESITLPTDPRIIGAYVVGGVTRYTYADSGPLPQLAKMETVQASEPARSAHVPFDNPRRPYPTCYRLASYLRAYAADTREWPMVPIRYATARHWSSPCPRHLAIAIHQRHAAARRAVA